jgi:hypothetical protein
LNNFSVFFPENLLENLGTQSAFGKSLTGQFHFLLCKHPLRSRTKMKKAAALRLMRSRIMPEKCGPAKVAKKCFQEFMMEGIRCGCKAFPKNAKKRAKNRRSEKKALQPVGLTG